MPEAQKTPTTVAKTEEPLSQRFTKAVMTEFGSATGSKVTLTPEQQRLARHLFIKIDTSLKEAEARRIKNNETDKAPIIWQNVNMPKLAMAAMHRVELGLDALADNHISPIPYWNTKENKYDLDLRIGYAGKDCYKCKYAIDPPDFPPIYQLIYSSDTFKPLMKNATREVESYEFEINDPFDRGKIVGGFAYYRYKDQTKNRLILVSEADFKKSEAAGNKKFWGDFPIQMRYKTIVNRATSKLYYDPDKTPRSYHVVEAEEEEFIEKSITQEIAENANKEVLAIAMPPADPETGEIKGSGPTPNQVGPDF